LLKKTEDGYLISEAYVLMWQDDQEGGVDEGLPLQKARTACLLASEFLDLLGHGRISLERKEKKKEKESEHALRVILKDETPLGNYLDILLAKIAEAKKPQSLKKWVFQLHTNSDFVIHVLDHLTQREILEKKSEKRMLGLSSKQVYTLKDEGAKERVRNRLRGAALENTNVNGTTLALLGIFLETDILLSSLLNKIFAKEEHDHAINQIKLRVGRKKLLSSSK